MAPKKKGKKGGNDDWEAELGETIPPASTSAEPSKTEDAGGDAEQEEETGGGGGLLASIQRRGKKAKNKKNAQQDFVEGEDPTAHDGAPEPIDLAAKAPQEATMDDEDTFSAPAKKGQKGKAASKEPEEADDGSDDGGGRVKTKKEKEREKKEREKQRKKEQVSL